MDKELKMMRSPEAATKHLSAFEISLSMEEIKQVESFIPEAGALCPQCRSAKIDYDGMLNLSCPDCSFTLAGCST